MRSQSIQTFMKKRFENDARKSDAKMMENCANMESKREPTSRNIYFKNMQKTMFTYDTKTGGSAPPPFNTDDTKPTVFYIEKN